MRGASVLLTFVLFGYCPSFAAEGMAELNSQLAALGKRAKELGCQPMGGFEIVSKIDDHTYEISYQSGTQVLPCPSSMGNCPARFGPIYKTAILKTKETKFSSAGIVDALMTKKSGSKNVKLNNGFTRDVPVFEESTECQTIVEKGNSLNEVKDNQLEAVENEKEKKALEKERIAEAKKKAIEKKQEEVEQKEKKKFEELYE